MDLNELNKFKENLKREYDERIKDYKRRIEEELADIAASKMLELEREMGEIEKLHSKIVQERLTLFRLKAIKLGKDIINKEANTLFCSIEERVKQRTEDARKEQSHYTKMLKALIDEAVEAISDDKITVQLSREEEGIAKGLSKFYSIVFAGNSDFWGGPIVVDEKGERIVENTIKSRFGKLTPLVRQRIGEIMSPLLEEIERA